MERADKISSQLHVINYMLKAFAYYLLENTPFNKITFLYLFIWHNNKVSKRVNILFRLIVSSSMITEIMRPRKNFRNISNDFLFDLDYIKKVVSFDIFESFKLV